MISGKYTRDYRTEYEVGPRGRLRERAVYIGGAYGFAQPAAAVRAAARRALRLTAGAWAAALAPLCFVSTAGHTAYVIFPHALALIPLALGSGAAWDMFRAVPPLRRREAELVSRRFPASALWLALLSGAGLAGLAVRAATGFEKLLFPGDAVFALCEALLLTLGVLLFRLRGAAETREEKKNG